MVSRDAAARAAEPGPGECNAWPCSQCVGYTTHTRQTHQDAAEGVNRIEQHRQRAVKCAAASVAPKSRHAPGRLGSSRALSIGLAAVRVNALGKGASAASGGVQHRAMATSPLVNTFFTDQSGTACSSSSAGMCCPVPPACSRTTFNQYRNSNENPRTPPN